MAGLELLLVYWIVLAIVGPIVGALIAKSRGRNPWAWAAICFVFGLVGILIVSVIPRQQSATEISGGGRTGPGFATASPSPSTSVHGSPTNTSVDLGSVSANDWIGGVIAIALVIDLLFFPWFSLSFGFSISGTSAPDGSLGILAVVSALLLVGDVAVERFAANTGLPAIAGSRATTRVALASAAAAFVALKFVIHLSLTSDLGWGFYLGAVLAAALVLATFLARSGTTPIPGLGITTPTATGGPATASHTAAVTASPAVTGTPPQAAPQTQARVAQSVSAQTMRACPHCGAKNRVPASPGETVSCGRCQRAFNSSDTSAHSKPAPAGVPNSAHAPARVEVVQSGPEPAVRACPHCGAKNRVSLPQGQVVSCGRCQRAFNS